MERRRALSTLQPVTPCFRANMVGLTRFELVTPRLSSVCSNQLSYRPWAGSLKTGQACKQALENQIDLEVCRLRDAL